ncbi:MAG: hypothetical protein NVSMB14_02490 [Isosphaeraceae bacterium]
MRMPSRTLIRPALLVALGFYASAANAAVQPEKTLPSNTLGFIKIDNAAELRSSFAKTQFGRFLADPAMQSFKSEIASQLDKPSSKVKEKIGFSLRELLELPQGTIWIGVVPRDNSPDFPVTVLISADAGKNQAKMEQVMVKATKLAQDDGGKVSSETFKGLTIHVIKGPGKDEKHPPLVWTHNEAVYYVSTDLEGLKELLSHADGREDSLASEESYVQVRKKVGQNPAFHWFLDISQVFKLVGQVAAAKGGGGANLEAQLQLLGFNGLKALGGGTALNTGDFDQLSKIFLLSPGPAQGVLKLFPMPKVNLKPEAWVPAGVATYEAISWDVDGAFASLKDLLAMFGAQQALDDFETKIAGPDGPKFSFEKDLIGPLGDRITILSEFKKPITEKSQRMLIGVALEDQKAFQSTFTKLIVKAGQQPKKREFQGTTIYDFETTLPTVPGAPGEGGKSKFSLAVAKDHLFVSTDPTFLEQILRGGGAPLADTPAYQSVAKQMPEKTSLVVFNRSEEQARLLYDMVKNGQLQKALENANRGGDGPKINLDAIAAKLPEFSVFTKYLSQSGAYATQDDDGVTLTRFSLKKAGNP